MKVVMLRPYCADFRVFTINDIEADVDDFGESKDWAPEYAPEYGCGHRTFRAFEYASKEILDKYHINEHEWEQICNMLEVKLDMGRCAYCQ